MKQGAAIGSGKDLPTKKEDGLVNEVALDLNGWGEDDDILGGDMACEEDVEGDGKSNV